MAGVWDGKWKTEEVPSENDVLARLLSFQNVSQKRVGVAVLTLILARQGSHPTAGSAGADLALRMMENFMFVHESTAVMGNGWAADVTNAVIPKIKTRLR